MIKNPSIVLRLTRRKGGKWRLRITATATKHRTRCSLTGVVEIKRLPDGLFAAGRAIEDTMLPRLAETVEHYAKPNTATPNGEAAVGASPVPDRAGD
jgi:hypothetical protein